MNAFVNGRSLGTKLESLVKRWYAKAELFAEHKCQDVAATYRRVGDELERDLREWEDERLTIQEAAAESGYSTEHLRRLVRDGKLDGERAPGGKSRMRLRRGGLPTKPSEGHKEVAENQTSTYDPEEDARSIAQRLGGSDV